MVVKFIDVNVYNTIQQLANEGNQKELEKRLSDCNKEIERRIAQKESVFPLQYEKKLLENVLQPLGYKNIR